jgi:hypothetical protein
VQIVFSGKLLQGLGSLQGLKGHSGFEL